MGNPAMSSYLPTNTGSPHKTGILSFDLGSHGSIWEHCRSGVEADGGCEDHWSWEESVYVGSDEDIR